ncbi:hypothetical protein MOF32_28740 [Priestia megaterium]|uniref:hypothetical protein n=1 Tax=Priestia megaterium TaxID=1404 RepID=UPI002281C491|nr:hypothetical protein [Priestia megaterium]MCY9026865.1 hypothetical protein [Priestia megaterium]
MKTYELETVYKFEVTKIVDEIEYKFIYEFSKYQLQGMKKRNTYRIINKKV